MCSCYLSAAYWSSRTAMICFIYIRPPPSPAISSMSNLHNHHNQTFIWKTITTNDRCGIVKTSIRKTDTDGITDCNLLYLQLGMEPKTSTSTKLFVPLCFKCEVWYLMMFGIMQYSLSSFNSVITWDFSCFLSTILLPYDCCCTMIHKCMHTVIWPIMLMHNVNMACLWGQSIMWSGLWYCHHIIYNSGMYSQTYEH